MRPVTGLSNKQIAARLLLSERTVDSHVRSIINKLGFSSRAQIAAWVASSRQPSMPVGRRIGGVDVDAGPARARTRIPAGAR